MVEDVIKTIETQTRNIEWKFVRDRTDNRVITAIAVIMDTYTYSYTLRVPEYTLNEWDYQIAFHIIDNILEQFNDDYFKVVHGES